MGDAGRTVVDVPRIDKGLDNVYVKETSICFVDGVRGRLLYRGYDIRDLADHSSFEETAFLLLWGRLPNREELARIRADLGAARAVPPAVLASLRRMPKDAAPMDVLRTAVSLLGMHDGDRGDASPEANRRRAVRLLGSVATIVAAYHRIRSGARLVKPDPARAHADDFLRMVTGTRPGASQTRVMDVALILYADHSMNASTFAATVAASTLSDLTSTIVAAIAALKGPLHGGAIEAAFEALRFIGRPEAAEAYVLDVLGRHGKVFGFGHRVYKTYDPRALIFQRIAKELSEAAGDPDLYRVADVVQETVVRELRAKHIFPNVDFYSGLVFHYLGLPPDLATAIFAMSRTAGWAAHVIEYWEDNRILRPLDHYVGPTDALYVPLEDRS
jgi:citrate synthase